MTASELISVIVEMGFSPEISKTVSRKAQCLMSYIFRSCEKTDYVLLSKYTSHTRLS